MPYLKKRGKVWYGVWWEGGKKRLKAFSPYKGEADDKLKDLNERLTAQKYHHKTVNLSWPGFCEEYLKWARSDKSPSTVRSDERAIRHFNELVAVPNLRQLSPAHLEAFKQRREGVSDSTLNRELDTLKSMGRWAHKMGYLPSNPFQYVQKKAIPKLLPRFYTEKEMKRIREAAYDEYELILVDLAYYSGMRRGEMANLKWENVDFKEGVIRVYKNTGWITKEKKEKIVPLDPRLEKHLKEWRKTSKHEFVMGLHEWPPVAEYFSELAEQILARAGLKGSLHWFRHTTASRLAENNVNLKKIADMLGHASTTTTERYTASQIKTMRNDLMESL